MYSRVLQGYRELFGPNYITTLGVVYNLGILYAYLGKLVDAESMFTQAIQGYNKAFGPKHTYTLNMINNIGLLYAN